MSYKQIHPDPSLDCLVLLSYRAGENTQLRGLAEAVAGNPRYCALTYRRGIRQIYNVARRTGLWAIAPAALGPPWPRLVISAGLRNEPVARWIRRESQGHTRIVFVGRTWARARHFDLVITTPQYRLPQVDGIHHNPTTLHGVNPATLDAAASRWGSVFERLPRPHIAVLIGGNSGPVALGRRAAARLATDLRRIAASDQGTLLITTSARTSTAATEALAAAVSDIPQYLHRWQVDDPANPYLGMLATADRLVVTSDSVGMVSEALAAGAPVQVFDLERHGDRTVGTHFYQGLQLAGPRRLTRDTRLFHQNLLDQQLISWTHQPPPAPPPPSFSTAVLAATVERVQAVSA